MAGGIIDKAKAVAQAVLPGHICYYCEPNDDGSRSSMHGNCIGYDPAPSVRKPDGDMPICTCPCRAFRSQR